MPVGPSPRRSNQQGTAPRTTTDTGDTDINPTWNTAAARLPAFLAALKRHDYLFSRTKGALSLYIRGYIVDSKNRKQPVQVPAGAEEHSDRHHDLARVRQRMHMALPPSPDRPHQLPRK